MIKKRRSIIIIYIKVIKRNKTEPRYKKIKIRQKTPKEIKNKIIPENENKILDKDILFISGETEMPLNVYESPLLTEFRKFKSMKKESYKNDNYYIVNKNDNNKNEILFLYGRGPIFELKKENTDRFDGFDD
jgi:hypothetical protein